MSLPDLRPYQHQQILDLRAGFRAGHVRQVVGSPTGSGKTILAAAIAGLTKERGRQTWFLCDRTPLIGQTVRSFSNLGLSVGVVWADNGDYRGDEDVVVASTQTLASRYRRCEKLPEKAGLFVIDECHVLHQFHVQMMKRWDAMPMVGLSATPMRKGLGRHFTNLVRGPSIAELIAQGYLVGFRCYGPSEPDLAGVKIKAGDFNEVELADRMNTAELIGDAISNWERLAKDRSTICFAVDIAHSKALRDQWLTAGYAAEHIDCHTPEKDRERIYAAFRKGEIQILCSVAVLALGFDVPSVECVLMARPTMSEALFIQQAGRGTRLHEGKTDCVLIDCAGNVARFGLPQNFLIPDLCTAKEEERAKAKKRTERLAEPCDECGYMLDPKDRECPQCGHSIRRVSAVKHRDAQLVSLDGSDNPDAKIDRKRFYLELRFYADARNMKPGWCFHKFIEKFGVKPPWKWQDMMPVPTSPETHRWIKSRQIAWAKSRENLQAVGA